MNTTETSAVATAELPASVLTKHQTKTFGPVYYKEHDRRWITAEVRYDDECNNGHNSFGITAESGNVKLQRGEDKIDCCGSMHDEIGKYFPQLAPFLKWHLTSTDGPLHYIANTVYWVQEGNLDYARSSAVWPEVSDEELLTLKKEGRLSVVLNERLPALMTEFKTAVESLGFVY